MIIGKHFNYRKKFVNSLKVKYYELTDTKFKMVCGHDNMIDIAQIKAKIFKIERGICFR